MKNYLSLFSRVSVVLFFVLSILGTSSCKDSLNVDSITNVANTNAARLQPYSFNWETVDWMPVPSGQTQISPPWIGQGSISSVYGQDIIYDHKKSDGWDLVYNTFDPNSSGQLQNPFFILYNKYRGLMRIYQYITTPINQPSNYLVDGVSIISNIPTSTLNYLGQEIVDVSQMQKSYSQIEPAPSDGSAPLASNKWYMFQYEFAYDPNMTNLSYDQIQLSWFVNYNSISQISLGGDFTGTVNGTIGSSTNELNSALKQGATTVAKIGLSAIGTSFMEGKSLESTKQGDGKMSPNNSLGLPSQVFTKMKEGINSALSAATGDFPGAAVGILSALIGGNSGSPTFNGTIKAEMSLKGQSASQGSFPSSPTSVYLPGTQSQENTQNYIPLINTPLGVFNLSTKPRINVQTNTSTNYSEHGTDYDYDFSVDNSFLQSIILYNPSVINSSSSGASIQNFVAEALIATYPDSQFNTQTQTWGGYEIKTVNYNFLANTGFFHVKYTDTEDNVGNPLPLYKKAVRVSFDVVPNNGSPKTKIIKTFWADFNNI